MPPFEEDPVVDRADWRGAHLDTALKFFGVLQFAAAVIGFLVLKKEVSDALWLMIGIVGLGQSLSVLLFLFALALIIEKLEDIRSTTTQRPSP